MLQRARSALFFVRRSLSLDIALLSLGSLSAKGRILITLRKYRALANVVTGKPTHLLIGEASVEVVDTFDVGTLVASIVDVGRLTRDVKPRSDCPVVVDVGANIGQFCVATKLFWPSAEVTSFEPDPQIYERLRANTAKLRNVSVLNVGLAQKEGLLQWHAHKRSVLSSFRPRSVTAAGAYLGDYQMLEVKTLDGAALSLGDVDLLKIDVEGYEYEVLAGATESLQRTRWLLVEMTLAQDDGPSNLQLLDVIHQASPRARIVGVGRSYGTERVAVCVDVLIDLQPPNVGD
jgi:FkbM family methyltransferase